MANFLVTGGAGFIGSHLVESLLAAGNSVVCIDDLSTGSLDNLAGVAKHPALKIIEGSVVDPAVLRDAGTNLDGIFHLAAAVGVRLIVEDPIQMMRTNIDGTAAVLEFASESGARVLFASTSEVYGKSSRLPYGEEDDVTYGPTSRPRWAYAISKAADEFLVRAYAQSRALPALSARLFNTAGPRQSGAYGMVIPTFVRQAASGGPIIVHGDGKQTRCFAHVKDVVRALTGLIAIDHPDGNTVNVGSRERVSIGELAERVRDLVNPAVEIVHVPHSRIYGESFEDMRDREPDLTKIGRLISYAPRLTLDDILRDVRAHEMKLGS
jgi:UDP-glucose 4-epimerase